LQYENKCRSVHAKTKRKERKGEKRKMKGVKRGRKSGEGRWKK